MFAIFLKKKNLDNSVIYWDMIQKTLTDIKHERKDIKLRWNHHCSWVTNVRNFRGLPLPINLHPLVPICNHLFDILSLLKLSRLYIYYQQNYVSTNHENFGFSRTLTHANQIIYDSTLICQWNVELQLLGYIVYMWLFFIILR